MHARLKHFLCILLSFAVFVSGIPMREAVAMNVTGAGYVTRGSLYEDEFTTADELPSTPSDTRMPASEVATGRGGKRQKPATRSPAAATDGAIEVIRSACRDGRRVKYTPKTRGPDGQNVFYRYIVADDGKTFSCAGAGVGPVKTIPKTEAGTCVGCGADARGGPAQSLEEIAAQTAKLAPLCPHATSPGKFASLFASQACMLNVMKGITAALVDLVKGIGYLAGAAVSWAKGKIFGTPAVHKTDNAMTKVMNFFRTMSRAKFLSIIKNTGAWIREMSKAFVNSIYESSKNAATCEKWSGVPLASECKVQGPGWACMNWNQRLQTSCSLIGAVGSDIALLFVGGVGVGKLVARSATLMRYVNATKQVAGAAVRTASRVVAAGGRPAQLALSATAATARLATGTVVFSGKTVMRAISLVDKLPGFKQYAHASERAFLAGFKIGSRTSAGSVRAIELTARTGQAARVADDVAGATHTLSAADIRAMTPPPPANARPLESTAQVQTRLRTTRDFKAPKTTPQKFEARNKGRSVIPESENARFRSQLPDPQPGGRTVVIRDEAQASNALNLSTDRSAAITSSMVERSALKFEQLAKKYKGEVNVTRFEGKNRLEVRVDPVRGTRLPDSIETEIADIYKTSVIEHTEFLKQNKLVRSNDDPTGWYKYGSGPDSQTANLTATGNRKLKSNFETNRWEDSMTQTQLETVFKRAQGLNKNLRERYRGTPLFTADGRMTPHIADIISKSKSAEELVENLKPYKFLEKDSSGRALTQNEKIARAEELREFVEYARNFGIDYYGVRGLALTDEACTGVGAEICRQIGRNLSHNATIFDGEYGDIVAASVRAEREAAGEFDALLDQEIGPVPGAPNKVDPMANGEDVSTIIRNEDGTPAQELPTEILERLANCKSGTACLRDAKLPARIETVIDGKKTVLAQQDAGRVVRELGYKMRAKVSSKFNIEVDANGRMTLQMPQSTQLTREQTIAAYDQLLRTRREFETLVQTYPNPRDLKGLTAASPDLPLGPRKIIPDGQDAFRLLSDRQAFDSMLTLPRSDGSQSFIRPVAIYPDANEKIRGMAFLLSENGINIVQGERRALNGSVTPIIGRDDKYLFIPDEVMASDQAMITFLEKNTKDLRIDPSKLSPDAARLVENAYDRQGIVTFEIKDRVDIGGVSKQNNVVGLNVQNADGQAGVVIHEFSHNSASKKLDALRFARPPKGSTAEQISRWQKSLERQRVDLTGQTMKFEAHEKFGDSELYGKYFRADEVEARWSQIAFDHMKGVDVRQTFSDMNQFIRLEGEKIIRLKAVPDSEWKMTPSFDGYTKVSADGLDFDIYIKYVNGATAPEQAAFIKKMLDDRYTKLARYDARSKRVLESFDLPASQGKQKSFVERDLLVSSDPFVTARNKRPISVKVKELALSTTPSPQLLGLNNLLKEKNIKLARGQARFKNGSITNLEGRIGDTIYVPESALKTDEILSVYIQSKTKDLRITRGSLSDDSVEVIMRNGQTRKMPSTDAIVESAFDRQGIVIADLPEASDIDGLAVARNYIEIDRATPNVGSAIIHETTHNTTTEKFRKLLNAAAPEELSNEGLAKWFKAYRRNLKEFTMRNLDFSGAGSERLGSIYKAGHRADEVEARIKEIGYQRSRNQDPSVVIDEALEFIDVQQDKIFYATQAGQDKWKLKPDGKYGAEVSFKTADGKDVVIIVPYVEGVNMIEQKKFISDLFMDRMKVLRGYKDRIKKMYPNQKAQPAAANDVAESGREVRRGQPSAKRPGSQTPDRRESDLIGYAAEDAPPMVMPDRTNRPPRPIQTVREASNEIRRRPGYSVRKMKTDKFVENNRARNIISKAENEKFRKGMKKPHPEGRTVVIRDFDKKKNNTTYGLDRSTAITTTLVERAAIRYKKLATKYADDVTMIRFEGPNRLEVRFEPRPGRKMPATLESEMADIFKYSVVEHADFLHNNQLVRATDDPTETFKYGSGADSHAANLAARSNREFSNQLATHRWEDATTQAQMETVFNHAKSLHLKIKEQYKGTDLIVKETGRIDPTIADIISKSDTPEAIIENLREYNVFSRDNKGRALSREEQLSRARDLDEYIESSRNLGIEYYGERTPLNLKTDDTVCFGSDLCGQNGRNLSHNTSILDGQFKDVVARSVRAEKASTDEFNILIDNTIAARTKTLKELGYDVSSMRSGDDVSMTIRNKDGTPVQQLDDPSLRQLANCTDGVACLRDAYLPAQIETTIKGKRAPRAKQEIIDAAHDLEKELKKKLPRRFKSRNFHVIIDKDGNMNLFMSNPKVMTERQVLEYASDEAMAQQKFAEMVNAKKPEETMGLRARAPSSAAPGAAAPKAPAAPPAPKAKPSITPQGRRDFTPEQLDRLKSLVDRKLITPAQARTVRTSGSTEKLFDLVEAGKMTDAEYAKFSTVFSDASYLKLDGTGRTVKFTPRGVKNGKPVDVIVQFPEPDFGEKSIVIFDPKTKRPIGQMGYKITNGKMKIESLEVTSRYRKNGYSDLLYDIALKENPGIHTIESMLSDLNSNAFEAALSESGSLIDAAKQTPAYKSRMTAGFTEIKVEKRALQTNQGTADVYVMTAERTLKPKTLQTAPATSVSAQKLIEVRASINAEDFVIESAQINAQAKKAETLPTRDLAAYLDNTLAHEINTNQFLTGVGYIKEPSTRNFVSDLAGSDGRRSKGELNNYFANAFLVTSMKLGTDAAKITLRSHPLGATFRTEQYIGIGELISRLRRDPRAVFKDLNIPYPSNDTELLRSIKDLPETWLPGPKPQTAPDVAQYSRLDSGTLARKRAGKNLVPEKVATLNPVDKTEVATASSLGERFAKIKNDFAAGLERRKIEKLLKDHVISDLHSGDAKARARAVKVSDSLAAAIQTRLKRMGIESKLARAPVDVEHLEKVEAAYVNALAQAKQIMTEQKYVGRDKKTVLKMIEVAERKLNGVRLDLAQGDKGPFTRILIGDSDSKFLTGVKEKLGIEELVFDLESKQRHSASGASYNGEEKRLQIPIETLLDASKKDLLSDVFLHEISHAAIERKRLAGVRTPYYIKVRSIGELPVTEMAGYEKSYSIDEINSYRKQIANIIRGRTLNKSVSSFGSFKMGMSDYLGSAGIQYRASLNAAQSASEEARSVLRNPSRRNDILIFKESKTPEVHVPVYRDNIIAGYIEITVTDLLPTDSVETVLSKTEVYLDEVDKMLNRNFDSFSK